MIGRGRAYVHGILAECHGADPQVYDAVLGEEHGTQPIAYDKQPYFPNANVVAPLPTTGTHIAYLDVWRREVTALENPDLVEKAIAVDTATRLQTAWQVRLLEVPRDTTCDSQSDKWDELTAPSAGRLTTNAVGVPVDDDPVHRPAHRRLPGNREPPLPRRDPRRGPARGRRPSSGRATTARSRSPSTGIDTARTKLTVTRVGRDSVARISIGDWVEVTDDWRELNGLAGELRKVADVDDGDETITLAAALPTGAFDPLDAVAPHPRAPLGPERRSRRRRRRRRACAGRGRHADRARGRRRGLVRHRSHAGAASTSATTGSSPPAPPTRRSRSSPTSRRAASSTTSAGWRSSRSRTRVVDCRTFWPPDFGEGEGHDCYCAACVTPESHASGQLTIQMAVDQVKGTGGKVCLQPGFYFLDQAVRIDGAQSLALEGKGWRTILVSAGREPAIVVQRSLGVAIDSLTVLTSTFTGPGALPAGIAIALRNTIGTVIERCVLAQLGAVARRDDGPCAHRIGRFRRGTWNCGRATDRPRRAHRRDADPRERARRDDRHRLHLGRHLWHRWA